MCRKPLYFNSMSPASGLFGSKDRRLISRKF